MYPWMEHPGVWFNQPFFIARNLVVMALLFVIARIFVLNALRGSSSTRFWGVVLTFLFVWHLSMIGIEWFMSIEKPWFSTLFGAFVMVSAFLSGICTCALIIFSWRRSHRRRREADPEVGGRADLRLRHLLGVLLLLAVDRDLVRQHSRGDRLSPAPHRHALAVQHHVEADFRHDLDVPVRGAALAQEQDARVCHLRARADHPDRHHHHVLADAGAGGSVSIPLLLIEMGLMALLTAAVVRSREMLLRVPAVAGRRASGQESHGHGRRRGEGALGPGEGPEKPGLDAGPRYLAINNGLPFLPRETLG